MHRRDETGSSGFPSKLTFCWKNGPGLKYCFKISRVRPFEVKKVVELYEQLRQRMGVVIIGPSGAGKSTIWKILHKTLEVSGRTITLFTFNPKSMPRKKVFYHLKNRIAIILWIAQKRCYSRFFQLLGHMDSDTREWFDGVITSAIRLGLPLRKFLFVSGKAIKTLILDTYIPRNV